MSFHLVNATTRRHFIRETIGSLSVLSAGSLSAETGFSDWAFTADAHIDANVSYTARGANMTGNFRSVAAQVLAEPAPVSGLFLTGDCAYTQGLPGDYAQLRTLLEPLRKANLEVHLVLGNHDHRDNFRQVFGSPDADRGPVPGKHLTVVRTPLVNWFLLDSLQEVNKVTGTLGEAQLSWLGSVLDQFPDQPAVLLGHHNPQAAPVMSRDGRLQYTGLSDTSAFFDLIHRKPQVQAYVFGHTHDWKVSKSDRGLHLINLPPTAYVFHPSRPNGWLRAQVDRQGFNIELRALNTAHPEHGQKHALAWR